MVVCGRRHFHCIFLGTWFDSNLTNVKTSIWQEPDTDAYIRLWVLTLALISNYKPTLAKSRSGETRCSYPGIWRLWRRQLTVWWTNTLTPGDVYIYVSDTSCARKRKGSEWYSLSSKLPSLWPPDLGVWTPRLATSRLCESWFVF